MTGYDSKRKMAADKLHWSDCAVHNGPAYPAGECDCGAAQEPVAQWLEDAFREGWEAYRESEFASKITENWAFGNSIANGRMIDLQQNTAPPQRPWVGLTVQERNDCLVNADPNECLADTEAHQLMVEVEAKLRERNS